MTISVNPTLTQDLPEISAILARLNVHARLGEILAREDRQAAREATIVCKWLDDGTVASQALRARAEGIHRFLEAPRHV